MTEPRQATAALADEIVRRVEALIDEAERKTRPLEVDPYHGQLFELFVMAEGAGLIDENAQTDLTADGLCQILAGRWGLGDATRSSVQQNARLSPEHMARMRMLWSVMRMWIEWTYAWQRWSEFHGGRGETSGEETPA